jgi:hypothetical protein
LFLLKGAFAFTIFALLLLPAFFCILPLNPMVELDSTPACGPPVACDDADMPARGLSGYSESMARAG